MIISRLNQAVKDSGKSKVQLSKECGITRVTLDNALQGGDIRISIVEAIAKALNVSVGYLFDENETSSTAISSGVNTGAAVNGNVSIQSSGDAVLSERVKYLEQILEEKERLIKVLMSK